MLVEYRNFFKKVFIQVSSHIDAQIGLTFFLRNVMNVFNFANEFFDSIVFPKDCLDIAISGKPDMEQLKKTSSFTSS